MTPWPRRWRPGPPASSPRTTTSRWRGARWSTRSRWRSPRGRTRSPTCWASCPRARRGACSRTSSTSTTCTSSRRRTSARCACPRCSRPAATRALPGRRRRHGPAGHRAGLAALRGGLARDLHGRGPGRGGGRCGRPRPRRRRGGYGDGARRAGGRRRAARVRHGGQGAAGRSGGAGRRARRAARSRRRVGRSARARPVARAGGRRCGSPRARRPRRPRRPGRQALPLLLRAAAPDRRAARARCGPRAGRARGGAHTAERARPAHPRRAPTTGLEGKFSLQYAVAATLLDGRPGIESFTDEAVARPAAQALLARVEVDAAPGGDWLLAGDVAIELTLADGSTLHAQLDLPPGAPDRPPSPAELAEKVADCTGELADEVLAVGWLDAGALLRERLPGPQRAL